MHTLWQDLRYAARGLRHAPGFTLIAAAVLAIGIGANCAIFSLVDAALVRPLPFPRPQELVRLWEHPPGYDHNSVSPLNFLDWSEQNHVFASVAAVSGGGKSLTTPTGAERIQGQSVSLRFFDLLGVKPIAGRTFTAEDAKPGTNVVVIGEGFWRSHFGANPGIVGSTIPLDGQPFTVTGVVPASFEILNRVDLWTLFTVKRSPEQRSMHYLRVIGRLKNGVTIEQARADMNVIGENIGRISPETNKGWGVTVIPLREDLVGADLRTTSLVLAGVVGFVLLMACANVANLSLARGAGRTREVAVRSALGGSQWRILRQLLTESSLLAALGGVAGIGLAWIIVQAAPSFLPSGTLPAGLNPVLDARVVAFAAAVTMLTGLLFGLAPAWHAARVSLTDALRSGGRTATGGAGAFRAVLAVAQIAAAVMLVSGAGLLLRTLNSLENVDGGFRAEHVLTMRVTLPLSRYPSPDKALAFYRAAEREVSALPGVRSVAFGGNLPMDGWDIGQSFELVDNPAKDPSLMPAAHYQMVGVRWFDTLGISLLHGRAFNDHDDSTSMPVCIVNEEFVKEYLPGREPIGVHVRVEAMEMRGPTPVEREIVGVIRQVKVEGPAEKKNAVEVYVPMAQNAWFSAALTVKTAGNPLQIAQGVRAAIARIDKDQPVTSIRTMDEVAADSVAQPRFRAELVGTFAGLALTLAAVGIFGVLAFAVSQRTREFGIRMALGASASDVLRLVIAGGFKIVAIGIAIGLAAAAALSRLLATLLFGVKPLDPPTFLGAPAVLALVALAACAAPALRASRVDPAIALRQD
jgi:putative ABC transport system permease protein